MKKPPRQGKDTRIAKDEGGGCASKGGRALCVAICLLLLVMVALVFGQTVRHEFIAFDDNEYVYENSAVTGGLTLKGVAWAFTHFHASNWHPLSWLSHMLDCQIYGLWPGGHHLTNVLLHAAATVLLFLALREMTGALWRCGFVAALFAIHPLHVESVAWVAERKDVLSGLFFMLTLLAYSRYARNAECRMGKAEWGRQWLRSGWYWGMVGFFALGLMSKPMLVTLPFVLLLLDYWPLRRLGDPFQVSGFRFQVLIEKLPLFLLSAASCVLTMYAQEDAIQALERVPVLMRVENPLIAYAFYLGKTILPVNLAVLYPLPVGGWPVWQVIAALLLLVALSVGIVLWRRVRPYLLVGWLWYVGMLVPVIGIIQVGGQAYADRYTYLPQIGLCLAGTWLAADWAGTRRWQRAALGWVGAALLSALMFASSAQTAHWHDSTTLWTHTLGCTRGNFLGHNNLGITMFEQGKTEEALAHFREALKIRPAFAEAHNSLGAALAAQGNTVEEIEHYRRALEIKPDYAEAHCNLGAALASQGKSAEAIEQYEEALRLNPDYADAHRNLGFALFQQGLTEEAVVHFREVLKVKPDSTDVHNSLGIALFQQGRQEQAAAHFREASNIDPNYADARSNLGVALLKMGRADEAIEPLQKAIDLRPGNAADQSNLAWALATAPRTSNRDVVRAVQLATQANTAAGGTDPMILRTLAVALAATRDFPSAVQTAQAALQKAEAESNVELAAKLRRELALYEAGQPFRDSP